MDKYEDRLKRDKIAALKLADKVTIKNELKAKLIQEIQGLRTRPTDYKNVQLLDKEMIKKVVNDVKNKLNIK